VEPVVKTLENAIEQLQIGTVQKTDLDQMDIIQRLQGETKALKEEIDDIQGHVELNSLNITHQREQDVEQV